MAGIAWYVLANLQALPSYYTVLIVQLARSRQREECTAFETFLHVMSEPLWVLEHCATEFNFNARYRTLLALAAMQAGTYSGHTEELSQRQHVAQERRQLSSSLQNDVRVSFWVVTHAVECAVVRADEDSGLGNTARWPASEDHGGRFRTVEKWSPHKAL